MAECKRVCMAHHRLHDHVKGCHSSHAIILTNCHSRLSSLDLTAPHLPSLWVSSQDLASQRAFCCLLLMSPGSGSGMPKDNAWLPLAQRSMSDDEQSSHSLAYCSPSFVIINSASCRDTATSNLASSVGLCIGFYELEVKAPASSLT